MIDKVLLKEIDINDPFFDSLKSDYSKFNEWFKNKQINNCYGYVVKDKYIKALLILKEEIYNGIKILKICTFKVNNTNIGIGSNFIKIINKYVGENNINYVYFTVYDKYNALVNFFLKNGFKYYGKNKEESIYLKEYTTILMPIKPIHAHKIMNGTKKYEYRKVLPKKNINKMVIYATTPIKKIIGEVVVEDIIVDSVDNILNMTKGSISKDKFFSYYKNNKFAVAYKLGRVTKYEKDLKDININYYPQSYVYLDSTSN